jgi:hypothetical protein
MSDLSFDRSPRDLEPRQAALIAPAAKRSPFDRYTRTLTAEGGVLIYYRDQLRSPALAFLRFFAGTTATGLCAWLIDTKTSWTSGQSLLIFGVTTFLITLLVRRRFSVSHSVEIRPDAMILDGEDVFPANEIGDNWPQLQMKYGDPDQLVICGISGTRLIDYMTVNRWDKYDRTPEILEADLKIAMEQLWGRREVTFATTY